MENKEVGVDVFFLHFVQLLRGENRWWERIQSMPLNPPQKKAAEGLFLPSYTVNQQALNI